MIADLASMTEHLGKLRGNGNNDRHGGGNDRGGGGRHHSAGHRGSLGVGGASGISEFNHDWSFKLEHFKIMCLRSTYW